MRVYLLLTETATPMLADFALWTVEGLRGRGVEAWLVTRGADCPEGDERCLGLSLWALTRYSALERLLRHHCRADEETVIQAFTPRDLATACMAARLMTGRRVRVAWYAAGREALEPLPAWLALAPFTFIGGRDYLTSSFTRQNPEVAATTVPLGVPDLSLPHTGDIGQAPVRLLHISPLAPGCGLDTAIRHLATLPPHLDWHLCVCGTGRGPYTMPLVRLCRQQMPGRVEWLGDEFDPWQELADSSMLINSHGTVMRTMAQAAGTPFSVDQEQWSQAITAPARLADAGHNARRTYEAHYTFQPYITSLISAYNDCQDFHHRLGR